MKTATLSLLAATAVFAGTSIYLAVQLGAARDALAVETQARTALEAQVRQPEARTFDEENEFVQNRPGAPPPAVASLPAPDVPPTASRPFNGRTEERRGADFNSAAAQRQRRLMQETRLRQQFADMPGELGLDKTQSDKLFDLLADSQSAAASARRIYSEDPTGSRALDDAARRERDAQITALLGPDKAAEFLGFEKSIGARMQVGRIDADLTSADIPLRDDQRKALIVEIAAEQAARPAPQRDPSGNDTDYQSRYLDWQAEYSQRVQQRVEPLLTADQLTRYREAVELQNARRAQQRARAEARRDVQPGQ